jgi:DNA-binding transcriptional LysR family regulator
MNNDKIDWSPFKTEIKCFLACVEYGTMTKAAERVGLTQASLTKIIQKMESDLKTKLFVRNSRGIELTTTGKEFSASLIKIEQSWMQVQKQNLHDDNVGLSEMTIGAHSSIASALLPKISDFLFEDYKSTQFKFEFKRSIEVTQMVVNGEIDIGFVINPIKNNDLIAKPLSTEHISLWARSATSSKTVLYNSDMFLSDRILKLIKNSKTVQINDYEVIGQIISQTSFQGLLPSTVAPRFHLIPQSGKLYTVNLSLIYRKDRFVTKKQKLFILGLLKKIPF